MGVWRMNPMKLNVNFCAYGLFYGEKFCVFIRLRDYEPTLPHPLGPKPLNDRDTALKTHVRNNM